MLTIAGNGMGDYTFDNLAVNPDDYDVVVCDRNFKDEGSRILKLGYREARDYILAHYRDQNILYVVTGSPLFFSAGTLLARALPREAVTLIDNTSSLRYLLARLGIAEQEVAALSLHGRTQIDLRRFLDERYTFVLCDRGSLAAIREATRYLSPEDLSVTIGYKLGYPDEVIAPIDLWREDAQGAWDLAQPYVLLLERRYEPPSPLAEDGAFGTERGMITKHYKRHLALQRLDLLPGQLLWDVGAGSGSIAIAAYTRYRVRTVLFEKQPQRCEHIRANLAAHRVCATRLIEGDAAEAFGTLPDDPDRIFVGGGGESVSARLPELYDRLTPGGILLINAITLRNLTHMIGVLRDAAIPYEVISLSLTTYKGALDMIEPERQLFQIKVIK